MSTIDRTVTVTVADNVGRTRTLTVSCDHDDTIDAGRCLAVKAGLPLSQTEDWNIADALVEFFCDMASAEGIPFDLAST